MLVNSIAKDEHGTDLVSEAKFWNFTVRYDYMVPAGANSGFYLRGRHELQILDDYSEGKPTTTGNASFYNFAAPSKPSPPNPPGNGIPSKSPSSATKPPSSTTASRSTTNSCIDRPTGGELDGNVNSPGPILLQGDHGAVAFRNLRIRVLP
jgi:hypothetical protein